MTNPDINHNPDSFLPRLKVIGMGGGGSNAVQRMMDIGLNGVEFIVANTDRQALLANDAQTKVLLGPNTTRGMGAGSIPSIGFKAALESEAELRAALAGADMVFLTAGMGGGTGTGSIPVAARIAKEEGAEVIAIVTLPFSFEGNKRLTNANQGLEALRSHTDTLITIHNDKLLKAAPIDTTFEKALCLGDDVLRQAVQGITELITGTGVVNRGFADIRAVLNMGGGAQMTIGYGAGEDRVLQAIHQALNHPLLESVPLEQARGLLINVTGNRDLPLYEISIALSQLQELMCATCEIAWGASTDERLGERVQVTLIVTGLGGIRLDEALPGADQYMETRPSSATIFQTGPAEVRHLNDDQLVDDRPVAIHLANEPALASQLGDLDMPAFLRRRVQTANRSDQHGQ